MDAIKQRIIGGNPEKVDEATPTPDQPEDPSGDVGVETQTEQGPAKTTETGDLLGVAEEPPIRRDFILPLPNNLAMHFRLVEEGTFGMGSPKQELGHQNDERLRQETILEPFYIGETEVTQGQYASIMGEHPSQYRFGSSDYPAEQVRFSDLMGPEKFFDRFNRHLRESESSVWIAMLPSEAEWEYACRAGTSTALYDGNDLKDTFFDQNLSKLAYFAQSRTTQVRTRRPNDWGLYDMLGNVWEWTAEGTLRGGSWSEGAASSRSASRLRGKKDSSVKDPRFGFRIVLKGRSSQ